MNAAVVGPRGVVSAVIKVFSLKDGLTSTVQASESKLLSFTGVQQSSAPLPTAPCASFSASAPP